MKYILLLSLTYYSFYAYSQTCDCIENSHKEDYQQASLVLRGSLEMNEESSKKKPVYNFTTEALYKNNSKNPITSDFRLQIHLNHHENCRPALTPKKSYIFYITNIENNVFYLHSCHRMYEVSDDFINTKRYIELLEFASIKEKIEIPKQTTPQIEKYKKELPKGKFGKLLEKHHSDN
jgi:hypothetical protein